jgi:hypothetical protein
MKQMTRATLRVVSFMLPLLFASFSFANAQEQTPLNADFISSYGLRNLENALVLHASPKYPEPGEAVHLTVESPIFDLSKDEITWVIDGKQVARGVGKTSFDTTLNSRGTALSVTVSAVDPIWGTATNALEIVPLLIDILYEGSTYVPPFYRGRPLPSADGSLRLQAVTHLVRDGKVLDDEDITFTWYRNSKVIKNFSGQGISKILIEAPALYDTDAISVRVASADESLSAVKQITIPSTEVALVIYENHPLFGILFNNVLPPQINGPADISVAAMPYFATIFYLNDPTLRYSWKLNGNSVQASSTKRNEISLQSDGDVSELRLEVSQTTNFFLSALGKWLFLRGAGQSSSMNQDNEDIFHSAEI